MRRLSMVALLCVLGAIVVLAQGKHDAKEEIWKADEEFSRVTGERGIEGFASFIAEDFHSIRPNSPIIGKKEIVASWTQMLVENKTVPSWKPLLAVVSASGDLGYTVGAAEFRKAGDPSGTVIGTSKYVTIWKKQSDGSWKVILDTGVSDTLPPKP